MKPEKYCRLIIFALYTVNKFRRAEDRPLKEGEKKHLVKLNLLWRLTPRSGADCLNTVNPDNSRRAL